jgi:hypothetical protein
VTLTGRVEKRDIGAGAWVLVTDDGRQFELKADGKKLQDGQTVEIQGHVAKDTMGVGMVGDFIIEVERVKRV